MADIEVAVPGTKVSAQVGDEIVVRLPETATSGYQWTVERVTGPLEVVSSELLPAALEGIPPGATGERFIRVAATNAGAGAVRLELRRVWETEPAERFEFQVAVA